MQRPSERPEVPTVDVRQAWERVESGEAVIVDVREDEEVAEASVPGAIHIPLGQLPAETDRLPHDRELLMLCRSGNRSAYATAFLLSAGFPDVVNIEGGIIAWAQACLPYRLGQE